MSDPGRVPPDVSALPAGLTVLAVDHVGVAVAELGPALARWTGLLGLVEVHREENRDQGLVEVLLAAPSGSPGSALQLLAPTTPGSPVARFLDRRGPGLQHLAVRVPDVAAATRVLTAAGLRPLYPEARPGTQGSLINFLHPSDAGGVLLELVESARLPHGEALP